MAPKPWDGGQPVSARGRYWDVCFANLTTQLTQDVNGAAGDELDWLYLYPTNTSPGALSLWDGLPGGGGVAVWVWPAGIVLTDLRPIFQPFNLRSRIGPWYVVCPATMSATASGAFSG